MTTDSRLSERTTDPGGFTITVESGTGQEMVYPDEGEPWMRHFVWAEAVGPTKAYVWQLTTTTAMREREEIRAHLRKRVIDVAVNHLLSLELP